MMFNPGDVVVIPYPFADQTRTKLRPVLVITAPDGQGDFIGLAITSKGYHALALTQSDMQAGKLPKPSWVRTDKVFTLNDSLMVKTVGRVTAELLRQALSALCGKIGCQSPP